MQKELENIISELNEMELLKSDFSNIKARLVKCYCNINNCDKITALNEVEKLFREDQYLVTLDKCEILLKTAGHSARK